MFKKKKKALYITQDAIITQDAFIDANSVKTFNINNHILASMLLITINKWQYVAHLLSYGMLKCVKCVCKMC